jgi:CheY-like chemotaxis protein
MPTSRKRVLVVDDNLDAARSMVLLLRRMGHEVDFAINGYAAMEVAHRLRPEFVFLDLGLPDTDGWAIAKRLRSDPSLETTRILAVTGRAGDEDRRRSLEAGCDQHLVKPVDAAFLESLLGLRETIVP